MTDFEKFPTPKELKQAKLREMLRQLEEISNYDDEIIWKIIQLEHFFMGFLQVRCLQVITLKTRGCFSMMDIILPMVMVS